MLTEVANRIRKAQGEAKNRMPLGRSESLVLAAAAVSALHKRPGYPRIADAIRTVAKTSGINAKEIESFRDNISRGLLPTEVCKAAHETTATLKKWSPAQIKDALAALAGFVKIPRYS